LFYQASGSNEISGIEIFDSKAVMTYSNQQPTISERTNVDIPNFDQWATGIYFIRVTLDDGTILPVQKLVKL